MPRFLCLVLLATAVSFLSPKAQANPAAAQESILPASNLQLVRAIPLVRRAQQPTGAERAGIPQVINAVDPNAIYSNVTNLTGVAYAQGPASGGFTRVVMDDLTFTTLAGVSNVTTVRFSVANLNATTVTVAVRVHFWNADGAPLGGGLSGPGTYIAGYSFGAAIPPGGFLTGSSLGAGFPVPAATTTTIWAGVSFDNNGNTTGATDAELDNLGQVTFSPTDVGSSTDNLFETTAAGNFFGVASPAGSTFDFSGSPPANMAWELVVDTLPVELSFFSID